MPDISMTSSYNLVFSIYTREGRSHSQFISGNSTKKTTFAVCSTQSKSIIDFYLWEKFSKWRPILSPFLEKSLRRRQLQSTEWRCDRCFEENGRESTVQIWCQECEKILCQSCKRFHSGHVTKDFSSMTRVEAIRVITTDDCRRHRQSKDAFCQHVPVQNMLPGTRDHLPSVSASSAVGEEGSVEREDTQPHPGAGTPPVRNQHPGDTFVEEARLKLAALCDNMKVMAYELQTKWQNSLKEKENLLKKVEIWHHTLVHLSTDDADDEDVVCGLRLVGAELSARLRQSFAPQEKGRWLVTFPKWCHDSLESLKKEIIVWEAETSGHLQMESECRLQGSNPMDISSIVTGDNRVFVGDFQSRSILEFSDSGEMVGQCSLTDGGEDFYPLDMCRLSEDILIFYFSSSFFRCFLFLSFVVSFLFFSLFFLFSFFSFLVFFSLIYSYLHFVFFLFYFCLYSLFLYLSLSPHPFSLSLSLFVSPPFLFFFISLCLPTLSLFLCFSSFFVSFFSLLSSYFPGFSILFPFSFFLLSFFFFVSLFFFYSLFLCFFLFNLRLSLFFSLKFFFFSLFLFHASKQGMCFFFFFVDVGEEREFYEMCILNPGHVCVTFIGKGMNLSRPCISKAAE
ncbi:unnamed protein product [Acanthosepion pharaonis]|uniref:B box-type domain-containing protein n=1 Tax=Acanthosepion pharaonis TaxID=158019 RepID=A0A812DFD3_ACAPH|nr:unnamed protein product [Sepia pharaonis]